MGFITYVLCIFPIGTYWFNLTYIDNGQKAVFATQLQLHICTVLLSSNGVANKHKTPITCSYRRDDMWFT